ncbi:MAG: hypothetical protein ACXABI_06515 [Candidatus Hodarchaeales archaeon]
MVRCDLKLTNEYDFKEIESGILIPTVPLKIHRQGMNRSIVTEAIIDTGYERGLLLSTDIRDLLFVIGDPDRQDSLSSGNIEIPCDVFLVRIKIFDRWLLTEGFAPKDEGFETIIGTELLKLVNICIRGPENKTYIADLLST